MKKIAKFEARFDDLSARFTALVAKIHWRIILGRTS